jgi:hypothetical protein
MANEAQEQSAQENQAPVADPLDAANLPNNGTAHPFDSFQDEVQAALNGTPDEPQRPEQSADEFEELDPQATNEPDVDPFEEEESEEEEDEPELNSKEKALRARHHSDEDKAIVLLSKARKISLAEAARIISGEPAKATESTQEQAPEKSENLASIEAELDELYDRKDAATRAIDVDEQADIDKQIRQLEKKARVLAVTEAEQSARNATAQLEQAQQDFDTTWDFSRNRYPELNDPNSAMYKEVARLDAEMQELGDPLASDPKRLWDLAKRAGLNTRTPMTKPGDKSSAPQKGKQSSPVQPASGNARAATTDPAKRTTDVIEGLKTADDFEELVASLGR